MDPLYGIWTGFAVLVGAVLGSFANVCIARWPEDRSVIAPRSACPSCGAPVAAWDNVPVVSWLILRGRCRACGWSIPVTYPLVELLGALVGWLVFVRFVPDGGALTPVNLVAWAFYLVFAGALLIGAFVDLRHRILPDEVTIYAVPLGVAGSGLLGWLGFVDWMQPTLADSVAGALLGAVFFGSVSLGALVLADREGLGWGDVKLLAMIGSFLGVHPAVFAVMLSASLIGSTVGVLALLITRRRGYLPFGPPLAFCALAYLLYAPVLLPAWTPWLRPIPIRTILALFVG